MRVKLLAASIILLIVSGCRSDTDIATLTAIGNQTPTQEQATWTPAPETYLPTFDGFELINTNPFLDDVAIEQYQDNVFSKLVDVAVPRGYTFYWVSVNADGNTGAEHGAILHTVIERQQGLVFDVGSWAGRAGYALNVRVSQVENEPVCLFMQWFATYALESPHGGSYGLHGFVRNSAGDEALLWTSGFPSEPAANISPFWTTWVSRNGYYTVTIFLDFPYATAAPNHIDPDNWVSWFLLRSFAVGIDTTGEHCNEHTPMI